MTKIGTPIRPYSNAVISNNLVFVSGQLPSNPTNDEVINTFEAAVIQTINNLKTVLVNNKSSINKVVKVTVYLKQTSNLDLTLFNRIYTQELKMPYPARSLVVVSDLPRNALVMIEAIAEVE